MKMIKAFLKLLTIGLGLAVLSLFLSDFIVEKSTRSELYNSTNNVPSNKVGLLLGTIKYLTNGNQNLFYKYRIDAAVELYKSGKIKYVLVSGDNSRKNYDEPSTMKQDLIKRGIPAKKIYLDYAGFRTLDSVVRAQKIFGQTEFTVISQQFHNERAIFIAKRKGLKAIGYNAKDVPGPNGKKVKMRERFARVKMMMDLVFGKKPKFLGEQVEIAVF